MDILKTLGSALGGEDKGGDLVSVVMNLIGSQSGGLNGLIEKFTSKGLGDVVGSWVGNGKNLPISAEQIQDVFGSDLLSGLASKLGMDSGSLAGKLSDILPEVVNKLTPEGKVPEGDILGKGMDMIGGLFGDK